jgi:hypothetical protein
VNSVCRFISHPPLASSPCSPLSASKNITALSENDESCSRDELSTAPAMPTDHDLDCLCLGDKPGLSDATSCSNFVFLRSKTIIFVVKTRNGFQD